MIGFLHNNKQTPDIYIVSSEKNPGDPYIVMPLRYLENYNQVGHVSYNNVKECIEDISTFLNINVDNNMKLTIDGCPIRDTISGIFGAYKTTPYKKIYNMVQEACLTKEIEMPGWFEVKYSCE
jgi:hypothetical protein